jgi:cystathionine beta-synthase
MQYHESIVETIGHTPLIRLKKMTQGLAPLFLAKCEMFNPGGSVKDRIGMGLIEQCEREGLLKPGGTIVEPTSGNTGMGLAIAAAIKGYRCIFVMTDKASEEKRSLLRAFGAEVVICPSSVPFDSPESYKSVAARLARELPNAVSPNQYANPANREAHYRTTGPEIWEATDGKVTCFVAGIGTGGTITGTARYLKERNPAIKIIGADPPGSVYSGDTPRPYKVEGIGMDHFPANYHAELVDEVLRVDDRESFRLARRLAREEGILAGGSAGTALGAALRYGRRLSADDVVVVLLPDTGRGYLSKVYNDIWLRENGLADARPEPTLADVLAFRRQYAPYTPLVIGVGPEDLVATAIDLFHRYGISQLPVLAGGKVVGSMNENHLLQRLASGEALAGRKVAEWQASPMPVLDVSATVEEAYTLFTAGQTGIAVVSTDGLEGVISKSDLLEYWAHQGRSE